MRRWMFLLSLTAVLAGTPLRLLEAADDFARSLAENDQDVNLEQVDGGVGDDSGATIKPEVVHTGSPLISEFFFLALPNFVGEIAGIRTSQLERAVARAGPVCSGGNCVWFQRFLC